MGTHVATLSGSFNALAAALPVLLSVVFFFYFNAGVWAVIATVDRWAYWTLIGLFALLGGAFLSSRAQLDLDALAHLETAEELQQALGTLPSPKNTSHSRSPRTPN
ncbi:hypothetical protein [Yimella sp. cx-51]|uniref:hypothetical protein n=1 Tax=Yimella sp. cx-51 TaxID=2770551 RepID=UPI00165D73F4|nr:hypothetical protein [Yimella sp. cx-51]MBC9955810.1 hypothetical protein [Yimella sp. cx-51]QTH37637.1 hypothetical protein J5M86_12315 [Yimella sp. cx-51]